MIPARRRLLKQASYLLKYINNELRDTILDFDVWGYTTIYSESYRGNALSVLLLILLSLQDGSNLATRGSYPTESRLAWPCLLCWTKIVWQLGLD